MGQLFTVQQLMARYQVSERTIYRFFPAKVRLHLTKRSVRIAEKTVRKFEARKNLNGK